ncbi:MAG: ABC transporter substrate-binding protein [Proteobacteria bacterium]|nr:ABC transporter substrate-binding protein [Pseudomonadota bacterium]MBI3496289.1 ABC transporter substrate-binding protein [Pseudomonadota bacterium]
MKFAAAVAALLASTALQPIDAKAATPKDTLVIADAIDDIVSLDPAEAFEFSGEDVTNNVYDALLALDPNQLGKGYAPGIAESWSISPDTLTYTFKIKQGLKFHSGNPLTASDAAYTLQRAVILKKTPSFILTQFGFTADNVKQKIRATGPDTLVFEVDKPYAPSFVLNCLTANITSIVDQKTLMANEKSGDMGYEWLKTNDAGSGAYKLRSWKASDSYILEKADGVYWRGDPQMKRVIMRHVAETGARRLLLAKGDIDVARGLPPNDIAALKKDSAIRVDDDLKGRIYYFSLNMKNPTLAKPEVIEAMKYLVDYDGMRANLFSGQMLVHQAFLPRTFLGAIDDAPYRYDVAKAKDLLSKAGLSSGFSVTMDVRTQFPTKDMAEAIQASFAKGGIKLEIIPGDGRQTLTKYRARNHDIYIGSWGPDYPDPNTNADTFARNTDNRQESNNTGSLAWRNSYDIPALTKMTDAATLEKDSAKRAVMYGQIQREHQRTSPFVIMFQELVQTAERKNVTGFITGGPVANAFYWTVKKQ